MKYLEIKGEKKSNPKLVKLSKTINKKSIARTSDPGPLRTPELLNSLSSPIKNITE